MKQFITDETGRRVGVILDLDMYQELLDAAGSKEEGLTQQSAEAVDYESFMNKIGTTAGLSEGATANNKAASF
jgi:hypothetical protein